MQRSRIMTRFHINELCCGRVNRAIVLVAAVLRRARETFASQRWIRPNMYLLLGRPW